MFHVEHPDPGRGILLKKGLEPMAPSAHDLSRLVTEAGLSIPTGAGETLAAHAAEMLRWNRAIRLTAITDPEEVAVKHILDSLLLLHFLPFPGKVLDFGSGAGYPGIPLAVLLPETEFTLLDSSGKKCSFLKEVARKLSLRNVHVLHARLGKRTVPALGRFEHIVTRATLPPVEAFSLLHPFLCPGGRLFLMTGGGTAEEGDPFPIPGEGYSERTASFSLPRGMGTRRIREIRVP
jgi:16S rRNA (guanine527-N7)-methyltransferase